MRLGLLTLVLIATLFGGGYWYDHANIACDTPIRYRVGEVDERFGTNVDELKRIAELATEVWEKPLQQELFIYDESEDSLPIKLVFDDRQKNADIESELKEDLTAKEGMSQSVAAQYEELITEFRKVKKNYEASVLTYEERLASYNKTVTEWNDKGGAPKDVITELEEQQSDLTDEQHALEALAAKLNRLVVQLNAIGAQGNSLITDYNTVVNQYNDKVAEAHEFTQGDYTGDAIDIYQFDSEEELIIVLAHEFGHALALDHVPNELSVMYQSMDAQELRNGLSAEDTAEFTRVCSDKNQVFSFLKALSELF